MASKYNTKIGTLFVCAVISCSEDDLKAQSRESTKRALRTVDSVDLVEAGKKLEGTTLTRAVIREVIGNLNADNVVKRMLSTAGVRAATATGTKAIPVVGWVMLVTDLVLAVDYVDNALANNVLSQYIYDMNIAAAIEFANSASVCKDEAKSLVPVSGAKKTASLSERAACFQYIAGFGGSRLYQADNGISPKSTITCPQPTRPTIQFESDGFSWGDLFNGVFDVVRVPDQNQQRVVLSGEDALLVCPSKFLRTAVDLENYRDNPVVDTVMSLLDACGSIATPVPIGQCDSRGELRFISVVWQLRQARSVIDWATETVGGAFFGIAKKVIPGLDTVAEEITDLTEDQFQKIASAFGSFFQTMIQPAILEVPNTGSETFDQIAAGTSGTAITFAMGVPDEDDETKIVGLEASAPRIEEAAKIDLAIAENRQFDTENKSIFARYLDLSDHRSLASTLLLNTASTLPVNGEPLGFGIEPLSALSNVGSLFNFSKKASAQGLPTDRSSIFGTPDYYYTVDELDQLDLDVVMTESYNAEQRALREAPENKELRTITNPHNGKPFVVEVHTRSNPYALANTYVTSLYKAFDPDTEEEYRTWASTTLQQGLDPQSSGGSPPGGFLPPGNPRECAPGTTFVNQSRTHIGTYVTVCRVNSIMNVNATISGATKQLLDDARADGINFAGWGMRDYETQIRLRREHCGTSNFAIYQMRSSECRPPTARPGNSMHEQGEAIDFTYNGSLITSRGNRGYIWLEANAHRYGLKNLPSEPWHWSTNGK